MYIGVIVSHTVIMAVFEGVKSLSILCTVSYQGPASEFLNIWITHRLGVIEIDQGPYVQSTYIDTR